MQNRCHKPFLDGTVDRDKDFRKRPGSSVVFLFFQAEFNSLHWERQREIISAAQNRSILCGRGLEEVRSVGGGLFHDCGTGVLQVGTIGQPC